MSQGGSSKKVSNGVLALSSAAILAVYTAGYSRTRPAAQQLAVRSVERRPPAPAAAHVPETSAVVSVPTATPAAAPIKQEAAAKPRAAVSSPSPAPAAEMSAPPTPEAPVATPSLAPEPAPAMAEPKVEAAPPPPPTPPPPPPLPAPKWKDGTFTGWGTSRHGDIEASVVIEGGQILSAKIAQCLTRYSCDVIAELPPQVPKRQSPEVDFVSGATQSANAFYYAVVEALSKAK
jgi:hypothetical protein